MSKEELFNKIVAVDKGDYSVIVTGMRDVKKTEEAGTCLSYSGRC